MDSRIVSLLERGTVDVIVKEDLIRKLQSGRELRIKLGIDPSGKDLHIGHMVVIRKLREFQELGHHIILLFGNFTGQIGDPTGKMEARVSKTQEELEKNAAKYLDQVKHILNIDQVEVVWNADWLNKLNFSDVIQLASNFTVFQMLERDMFQERIKKDLPISLHEFFYPLMQGYDSVVLKADVELGGTDQTFNLLAGRTLQKAYSQMPQDIVTVPLLEGLDGKMKMGKSENNYIAIQDEPREMYGKTMSIPDNLILKYFELATDVSLSDIDKMRQALKEGENPRNLKMRLARSLVSLYHGDSESLSAEKEFIRMFREKGKPDTIPFLVLKYGSSSLVSLMCDGKLVKSKSEARRLIEEGGVKVNDQKIIDKNALIDIDGETIIQAGKRRFLKVVQVMKPGDDH
ncbi:tyrosine--tRNA ligase [Candidatus Peregrinibacteria bacterium]|nr:tyrosine--tRNA ligase [Candidatus Peregrinibacteria bacterium]